MVPASGARPRWAYKLLTQEEHATLRATGGFSSALDDRDGYIHMCQAADVEETARLYYSGRSDVLIARVDLDAPCLQSPPLRVQMDHVASRDVYFPHIYGGPLPAAAVQNVWGPLTCAAGGAAGFANIPAVAALTATYAVSLADVHAARARIAGLAAVTPVQTCAALAALAAAAPGAPPPAVFFKCELFQRTGAFKYRGAVNAVRVLAEAAGAGGGAGVCTHSSGNHAAALAAAAAGAGAPCHVVMPSDAPAAKRAATAGYGARIVVCAPGGAARAAAAAEVAAATGARFVHPSEDPLVIAGQGTLALELLEQLGGDGLDALIVPVGGGGMLAGCAVAAAGRCRIIAAEPAAADDAARSKAAGTLLGHAAAPAGPATVADGLRTTLGPHTWPVLRDLVERVVTVSEAQILAAMRLVYERMKLVIEPSAAVGVAALLSDEVRGLRLRRIGVVLCGGNVDLDALPQLLAQGKEALELQLRAGAGAVE